MKIGAYQFAVTGDLSRNVEAIRRGVSRAAAEGVALLAFPECALTGYPPRDMARASAIDWERLARAQDELQTLADEKGLCLIAGTITKDEHGVHNSAALFAPGGRRMLYHKRALWGYDAQNFCAGDEDGIFDVAGLRVGVRICYEVRFPEYFRELYRARTDLNVILFYDVSDRDDAQRYDLIRGHVRTRAVENVCPVLSVCSTAPFQTAPTALYDRSGRPLAELERGREGLLVCDLPDGELDFGEEGRRRISAALLSLQMPDAPV